MLISIAGLLVLSWSISYLLAALIVPEILKGRSGREISVNQSRALMIIDGSALLGSLYLNNPYVFFVLALIEIAGGVASATGKTEWSIQGNIFGLAMGFFDFAAGAMLILLALAAGLPFL